MTTADFKIVYIFNTPKISYSSSENHIYKHVFVWNNVNVVWTSSVPVRPELCSGPRYHEIEKLNICNLASSVSLCSLRPL